MSDVKRISPQEAHEKVAKDAYVYVDVRTEAEFAEGHPEGAYNVPIMNLGPGGMVANPDFMSVMQSNFAKDAKLVVGCKAGGRSMKAAHALAQAGYTNILDQRAGWDGARDPFGQLTEPGWSRVQLPTETAAQAQAQRRTYGDLRAKK